MLRWLCSLLVQATEPRVHSLSILPLSAKSILHHHSASVCNHLLTNTKQYCESTAVTGVMGWLLLLALLSAAVTTVNGQAWYLNRPPVDFWSPDIDVSSQTRLPRVPPSPYGAPALICPQQNGLGYNVLGFPATPYIPTPFTQKYISPAPGVPTTTVCRTGDVDPKHCMVSYEISIDTVQLRPFDATIPSCTAFPPTELLAYNNQIPGPLITAPV